MLMLLEVILLVILNDKHAKATTEEEFNMKNSYFLFDTFTLAKQMLTVSKNFHFCLWLIS